MSVDIGQILLQYICLLFSLSTHEAAHAAMANRCGDPSARLLGRLTLNPIKHADPIGTVVLPLLMMITRSPVMFGWAKPVPFNPRNLNNIRRDPVLIAVAGPASNLMLAIAFTFVLRIVVLSTGIQSLEAMLESPFCMVAVYMVMINLVLMLFNCIPLPPLDGHHVLNYFLPAEGQRIFQQMGPFGLIVAVMLGGTLIARPLNFLMSILIGYGLTGFGVL